MRKRLYEIIEVSDETDRVSYYYDLFMLITILVSIIPLAFKNHTDYKLFLYTDIITTVIFIIDYIFRFITADYKLNDKSILSFIKYPFTLWAIIDLISILPTLTMLNSGFKLFRIFRVFRILRVLKVFKALRYSKSVNIIAKVIKKSKDALFVVFSFAMFYILISALIIFNIEPESFESFFDALYWATVLLTTIGYGDILPVTVVGKIITMVSSIFGIAIVALPAGIITSGYIAILKKQRRIIRIRKGRRKLKN